VNCHEAIDLMDRALEDALPALFRPAFSAHLEECPPCHLYLAQLGEAVRSLRRLPSQPAPDSVRAELLRRFREQATRDRS
jgi:anti-sigma factor RsiW